jgi:hypothetical protein
MQAVIFLVMQRNKVRERKIERQASPMEKSLDADSRGGWRRSRSRRWSVWPV